MRGPIINKEKKRDGNLWTLSGLWTGINRKQDIVFHRSASAYQLQEAVFLWQFGWNFGSVLWFFWSLSNSEKSTADFGGKKKVTQSCPTLCNPMDCGLPGSSVHGILQARILEWVAILSSSGFSQCRDRTWVSCFADRFFTIWATKEGHCSL